MLFPDTFYYNDLILDKAYTSFPTGKINAERILHGQLDCWEKPAYQRGEKKKKQLIFLDWRFFCLDGEEKKYYLQQLQLLFDEGFSVWFPTHKALVLLKSAKDLSAYKNSLSSTWNPSVSMSMQAATRQGIARDHIAVLDYFVMGQCSPEFYRTTKVEALAIQPFYQTDKIKNALLILSDLQALLRRKPNYYLQIRNELIAAPPTSLSAVIDVEDENLLDLLATLPIKQVLLRGTLSLQTILKIIFRSDSRFPYDIKGLYLEFSDELIKELYLEFNLERFQALNNSRNLKKSFDKAGLQVFLCSKSCKPPKLILGSRLLDGDGKPKITSIFPLGKDSNDCDDFVVGMPIAVLWLQKIISKKIEKDTIDTDTTHDPKKKLTAQAYFPSDTAVSGYRLQVFDRQKTTSKKIEKDTIDTDTTHDPKKKLTAQAYFPSDTAVSGYRLQVFDRLSNATGSLILEPVKAFPFSLAVQPVSVIPPPAKGQYTGQIVKTLNQTDWRPLPSLFPNEKLIAYQASSAHQSKVQLEFAYAENSNQYFVRLSEPHQKAEAIQIQYQLEGDQQLPSWKKISVTSKEKKWVNQLRFEAGGTLQNNDAYRQLRKLSASQRIAVLISALSSFKVDTAKRSQYRTMKDYTDFNYLLEKQVGACRHRSNLFLALANSFGIKVRIVESDCHTFVEIKDDSKDGKWIKQDLGGYPCKLHVNPLQTVSAIEEASTKQATEILALPQPDEVNLSVAVSAQTTLTLFSDAIRELDMRLAAYGAQQQQAMLIFPSTADIASFYVSLRDEKGQRQQQVLYLPSFRELVFRGVKVTESGYERIDTLFVQKLKALKAGDVLLINFYRYQMSDVGYNTLFDTSRRLGDIPIPNGVIILAAMDREMSQWMGEDVLSRFPVKQAWDLALPEHVLGGAIPDPSKQPTSVIELYDSPHWKEHLTGKFKFTGDEQSPFVFKQGELQEKVHSSAIRHAPFIEIRHAPLKTDSSCRLFFSDLEKYRTIEANGEKIVLPEALTWQLTYPAYEFMGEMTVESVQASIAWDQLLSPYTFDGLFQHCHYCNKGRVFTESSGLLEEYVDKTLRLYVTQDLPEGQWAKLCQQAKQYSCQLHFILGENVKLPPQLAEVAKPIKSSTFSARCYQSNDADLTLSQLKQSHPGSVTLPIDEYLSYAELVSLMQINVENNASLPSFHIQDGELLKYLKGGRTVILKGVFSPELASQLASLFATKPFLTVNGESYPLTSGQVILLTEQKDAFTFLANDKRYEKQDFTHQNRFEQLAQEGVSTAILKKLKKHLQKRSQLASWSFTQLKTLAQILKQQPTKNPLKSFGLFFSNSPAFIKAGNSLKQKSIFAAFIKMIRCFLKQYVYRYKPKQEENKRLKKLTTQLNRAPYVFIMGPSGIGKSTLVLEKLQPYYASKGQTLQLSVGMDQVVSWASDTNPDKLHLLFLDEANLNKEGTFNCFEGLFDDPPAIFIQGKYFSLTPQHKIIFCGNPVEFQGRQTHQFFQRHGHGLSFKNWSDQFLLATILDPLLKQVDNTYHLDLSKNEQKQITKLFLRGYQSVSKQTQQSLTPRNLQMMLLRFAALCQKNNSVIPLHNAYLALYDEVKPYLPKPKRKAWKAQFKQGKNYRDLRSSHRGDEFCPLGQHYIVPPSRLRALQLLQDQLAIREKQIEAPIIAKAGIHGLLLEGASGIGKSAFVIEQLRELGYQKANEANTDSTKRYYYLTLTDPGKIDEVLTKAFHEGAIVVVDELNTAPVEKILNALMSGVDLEGKSAEKAGFYVIGTQNPVSFTNRQALSPALANRFYKIDIKEYTMEELERILIYKGVKSSTAKAAVQTYEKHNTETSIAALKYTPRDLFTETLKKRLA